jgi:exopolysaccharide biosynthesis polyprenyl glycosylphosphotransferase
MSQYARQRNVGAGSETDVRPHVDEVVQTRLWRTPRLRAVSRIIVPFAVDVAAVVLAATICRWVAKSLGAPTLGLRDTLMLGAISLAVLIVNGVYTVRLSRSTVRSGRTYAVSVTVAAAVMGILNDLPGPRHGGLRLVASAVPMVLSLATGRGALDRAIQRGTGVVPEWRTLIVGAGGIGHLVARRLGDRPNLRLVPVGILDEDTDAATAELAVLGGLDDLEEVVDLLQIEHVIMAFPNASLSRQLDLIRRCDTLGLGVSVIPRLYPHITTNVTVEHLGGVALLTAEAVRPRSIAFGVKHVLDRVVSLAALVVLLPVLVATALAIVVTMGRPVLFRQLRVGRDGRMFTMIKFRTMRAGGPGESDETRVTRLGRFLRASSIDELPQLINVLVGDMSLIGPRPEQPSLVHRFGKTVDRYADRHRVKSGITGWAQVHGLGRGTARYDHDALAERVEWDNYYVENWSPALDFRIVLMTLVALVRFRQ